MAKASRLGACTNFCPYIGRSGRKSSKTMWTTPLAVLGPRAAAAARTDPEGGPPTSSAAVTRTEAWGIAAAV